MCVYRKRNQYFNRITFSIKLSALLFIQTMKTKQNLHETSPKIREKKCLIEENYVVDRWSNDPNNMQ